MLSTHLIKICVKMDKMGSSSPNFPGWTWKHIGSFTTQTTIPPQLIRTHISPFRKPRMFSKLPRSRRTIWWTHSMTLGLDVFGLQEKPVFGRLKNIFHGSVGKKWKKWLETWQNPYLQLSSELLSCLYILYISDCPLLLNWYECAVCLALLLTVFVFKIVYIGEWIWMWMILQCMSISSTSF